MHPSDRSNLDPDVRGGQVDGCRDVWIGQGSASTDPSFCLSIQLSGVHRSNLDHLWMDRFHITSPLNRPTPTTSYTFIYLIDIVFCFCFGCTDHIQQNHEWMDGLDAWMDVIVILCWFVPGWTDGWMDEWMDKRLLATSTDLSRLPHGHRSIRSTIPSVDWIY